jgi:EAL domain-containing protein (putative c-di-GMP-specific phosphodiesterase class I)
MARSVVFKRDLTRIGDRGVGMRWGPRVLPGQRLLIAIVAGVVLAGVPVLLLQVGVDYRIEQQGREEVESTARRGMALVETRIRRVVAELGALARSGVDGCGAVDRSALNITAFGITPIKEVAVLNPHGETLCTNHGLALGERQVLSRQEIAEAADVFIEAVAIGHRQERMVRVHAAGRDGGNGLAALIPTELLLPQMSTEGGSPRAHVTLVTDDGTLIGETGAGTASNADGDRVTARLRSQAYRLTMTSSMSRKGLAADQSDLRAAGILADVVVILLIILLFVFLRRRQRDNPVAELRRALAANEFVPYYQPILDITNGRLEGAEVLLRWRKRDGSIIPPLSFIPLLESSGLIFDVTRALMRRVCEEAGPAIGRRPRCKISFNLTARHFAEPATVTELRDIFTGSPISLSQVVLEVTERQPLENLTAARSVIAGLQELGARVAIDDVGAGHGGLSYLLKLGVDMIKVDKLFVDAIGAERHSAAIISSLVELARSMRMDIVAEGVESFEQVTYLRDQGIRLAQGYVFAPPLPGGSFLKLLEATDPVVVPAADSAAAGFRARPKRAGGRATAA